MPTISGSDFAATLPQQHGPERERDILDAVRRGLHVPVVWVEVRSQANGHEARIFVSADALMIGNAEDGLRVNVTAQTAQQIAGFLGTVLPTTRICNLIWQQALVRMSPCIQTPDAEMAWTHRMLRHSREVDLKLRARAGLAANVGKDWVLTNRLIANPGRAANYGWFRNDGVPIQSLGLAHNLFHVDYSQVMRLVRRDVIVDGHVRNIEELGRDPELAALVSSEGPLTVWSLPGAAPAPPLVDTVDTGDDPDTWRTLMIGMRGADVGGWQRQLMRDGYDLSPWNDDGAFGKVTHNSTVSWQRERGLAANGVVDAVTRAAIGSEPLPRPDPIPDVEIPFVQARFFGWANRAAVDVVVLHTMEAVETSTTAENVARWAAGPEAAKTSWHYAIDDDSIVQCVKEEHVAWAAPSRNSNGIQLEHAGYARQSAEQWNDPFSTRMLALSARLAARICLRWEIPIRFVDAEGLMRAERGITTHREITRGPGRGITTHTDPGPYFPIDRYIEMVRLAAG